MRWSTAFTCIAIAAEIGLLASASACAGTGKMPVGGAAPPAAAAGAQEVEVLADVNEVLRPYRMVGYVEAERLAGPGGGRVGVKDLLPILKERARQLGAQALIELETQPFSKEGRRGLKATAIAIVFTD
jgi:hypothetical protein